MYFQTKAEVVDILHKLCLKSPGYRAAVLSRSETTRTVVMSNTSKIHYCNHIDALRGAQYNLVAVDNDMYTAELISDVVEPSLMDLDGFSIVFNGELE